MSIPLWILALIGAVFLGGIIGAGIVIVLLLLCPEQW